MLSLWWYLQSNWCYSPSKGASGGILVIWDGRVVEKIEECVGEYIVACSFINIEDGFSSVFVGVYGHNYGRD